MIIKTVTRSRMKYLCIPLGIGSLVLGAILMGINLYGLTQPVRMPGLGLVDHHQLRFIPDQVPSFEQSMSAIEELSSVKPTRRLAEKANAVVN